MIRNVNLSISEEKKEATESKPPPAPISVPVPPPVVQAPLMWYPPPHLPFHHSSPTPFYYPPSPMITPYNPYIRPFDANQVRLPLRLSLWDAKTEENLPAFWKLHLGVVSVLKAKCPDLQSNRGCDVQGIGFWMGKELWLHFDYKQWKMPLYCIYFKALNNLFRFFKILLHRLTIWKWYSDYSLGLLGLHQFWI